MKIDGTQLINAPRERVYELLINPDVLSRCIPGCEQLEQTGENLFAATIKAGVGAIKGVFKSTVRLEDFRPNEHFRILVEGKGTPGFLKGSGALDLKSDNGATLVSYAGDIQVGGTIAGVGQRMILATAKMTANQFFTALEAEAKPADETPPSKPGFFRAALSWISGWLREVFRNR